MSFVTEFHFLLQSCFETRKNDVEQVEQGESSAVVLVDVAAEEAATREPAEDGRRLAHAAQHAAEPFAADREPGRTDVCKREESRARSFSEQGPLRILTGLVVEHLGIGSSSLPVSGN